MNRIGWAFLALFVFAAGLVALLVDFGGSRPPRSNDVVATPSPPVDPLPSGMLTLPVRGVAWSGIRDSFGEERAGGERRHTGVDIMAPAGVPVVAAAPGTVEKLFYSHGGGGVTAYVRSPDRRLSYYYAHLAGYVPTLREGARLRAGDPIGAVGDTGNAGTGNFHLHFGIERLDPDEPWYRGRAINPYPLLARGRPER
ncbi:M23 family metallopeptidase [Sphingomonas hankookensis]|uniref:M23 family peptidase n=1 Tax=Sphingomonas hengshuiensis TaxID=1609977 RepID=A0A2W4ZL32_9SPHN|nr:MAG: M23 family peptidase [Sphingomonas hengshuiensis]